MHGWRQPSKKQRVSKDEKVKSTKDTRAEEKKEKKLDPLVGKDADLPDKQLYDKALAQIKSGHSDVGAPGPEHAAEHLS